MGEDWFICLGDHFKDGYGELGILTCWGEIVVCCMIRGLAQPDMSGQALELQLCKVSQLELCFKATFSCILT